jgi:hypothetical protein
MNTRADKTQENKNQSVANAVPQRQSSNESTFQFEDNRPEAIAQRKLQEMANNSPQAKQAAQLQAIANNYSAQHQQPIRRKSKSTENLVVQRTKWLHDGTKWNAAGSSSSDTDPFLHPSIVHPNAKKDDQYDQQTGAYHSPMDTTLSTLSSSSGHLGFYDRRSTTGYSYASGRRRQGPHTLAHITKRVGMAASKNMGRDSLKLRGSRAFPRPRVMNKKLRDRLKTRGSNWKKDTRKMRTRYLRNYIRQWKYSLTKAKREEKLNALRKGMELNPATVYNIGKGSSTSSEMSGKGESRKVAASDLRTLTSTSGPLTSANVSGLTTMDLTGATPSEQQDVLGMTEDIRDLLVKDDVGEDPGSSESDSDLSDMDDV